MRASGGRSAGGVEVLLEAGDAQRLLSQVEHHCGGEGERLAPVAHPAQDVLLEQAVSQNLATDDVVAAVEEPAHQPSEGSQVGVDGLIGVVEVVPDGGVDVVAASHGVQITHFDRSEEPIGEGRDDSGIHNGGT